jgi:hypothetical protein
MAMIWGHGVVGRMVTKFKKWRRGGDKTRFQVASCQHGKEGNESETIFDSTTSPRL